MPNRDIPADPFPQQIFSPISTLKNSTSIRRTPTNRTGTASFFPKDTQLPDYIPPWPTEAFSRWKILLPYVSSAPTCRDTVPCSTSPALTCPQAPWDRASPQLPAWLWAESWTIRITAYIRSWETERSKKDRSGKQHVCWLPQAGQPCGYR